MYYSLVFESVSAFTASIDSIPRDRPSREGVFPQRWGLPQPLCATIAREKGPQQVWAPYVYSELVRATGASIALNHNLL